MIKKLKDSHFLRFCVVGSVGFLVDGAVLQAGISFLGLGIIVARIPSFMVAVLVTWYLNRTFTFRQPEKGFRKSFPAYIAANAVGLSLNFGSYTACSFLFPAWAQWPLLFLAVGSVVGLSFNFAASKFWIFKAKPD